MKRTSLFVVVTLLLSILGAQQLNLPNRKDSFHFAVIGDTGTGSRAQYQVGAKLAEYRKTFPFNLVVMMGDNMYGGEKPQDYQKKFEEPYKPLIDAGVKFYAVLGNHDRSDQSSYKPFNMNGERFFTFKPRDGIRFFALDSNYMDKTQLAWLEKELANSGSDWKIPFFHHPLYSSGAAHGSDVQLRTILEPMFIKYGVSLVLSGHDHFYERVKPQEGIHYFVVGGSAKLREGDVRRNSKLTAKAFDTDNSFMLMEIAGDELFFQAISRTGATVDSGTIRRPTAPPATSADRAK